MKKITLFHEICYKTKTPKHPTSMPTWYIYYFDKWDFYNITYKKKTKGKLDSTISTHSQLPECTPTFKILF